MTLSIRHIMVYVLVLPISADALFRGRAVSSPSLCALHWWIRRADCAPIKGLEHLWALVPMRGQGTSSRDNYVMP